MNTLVPLLHNQTLGQVETIIYSYSYTLGAPLWNPPPPGALSENHTLGIVIGLAMYTLLQKKCTLISSSPGDTGSLTPTPN